MSIERLSELWIAANSREAPKPDGSRLALTVSIEKQPFLPGLKKFAWLIFKLLTIWCVLISFLEILQQNPRRNLFIRLFLGLKSYNRVGSAVV